MGARTVGSRVSEFFGNAHGTIIEVREPMAGVFEYGVAWDDGDYAGETWTEQDLLPIQEAE